MVSRFAWIGPTDLRSFSKEMDPVRRISPDSPRVGDHPLWHDTESSEQWPERRLIAKERATVDSLSFVLLFMGFKIDRPGYPTIRLVVFVLIMLAFRSFSDPSNTYSVGVFLAAVATTLWVMHLPARR